MSMRIIFGAFLIHNSFNCNWSRAFRLIKSDVPTSTAAATIRTINSHIGSIRYFESGRRVSFIEDAFLMDINLKCVKFTFENYLYETCIFAISSFPDTLLPIYRIGSAVFSLMSGLTSFSHFSFDAFFSFDSYRSH